MPLSPHVFIVNLHLYPHCFFFPKFGKLLCSSASTKLYIAIRHVPLRTIHKALETCLVLWVVEMLIGASWIQPSTAQVAKVGFTLRACHVVA